MFCGIAYDIIIATLMLYTILNKNQWYRRVVSIVYYKYMLGK